MARTPTKTVAAKPSSRTATPKTATKPPVRRAPVAAAQTAPDPVVVNETVPVSDELELRKAELIEMVVERSEVKKRFAKPVIEAALEILGEALADGREMNLHSLGKIKINRMKHLSNARVINCKVRQVLRTKNEENDPLAEAAE
ncbi:integration host factor subunit alpha [Thalassovita gelatinovora]|uniref:Integration host factor subunit alpha n=1 Tax=Thalassovita gelatinovora TaxID=53501 RepID=A0A0P1G4B7_THAGE|nr:HU family DNA-binding protein [Thalassovita gelatinovora]QIZ79704.1 HU family DNA-binding protein [Thalassovita gelatinovora]CUH66686.1 integration host factor subunit alpha [Thalassovita gelatinovora]SEQ40840.1 DNA-binding protein HU-alpha [Thalassovita gelatinovora]